MIIKSNKKRGQVTVFLIIGIVILLLSASIFFIISRSSREKAAVEEKEAFDSLGVKGQVQSYVESCMRKVADPSVYLLAIQGGIIYPDETDNILLTDYGTVNYAWLNGEKGISKQRMEKDLERYLEENVDFCLGNFETFANRNIVIVPYYTKMNTDFSIGKTFIEMNLQLPLEINLPDRDKLTIESFSTKMKSSLGTILKDIEGLDYQDIDISKLVDYPYQPVIFPYDESVTIYSLSNSNPNEPLSFMFAVRNDFPENSPPVLDFIPDKTFKIGNRWKDILTAEDPNNDILTFSSDSDLFPVSEDGKIDVELNKAGTYKVIFSVKDNRGGEDEQEVSITILNHNFEK